MCPDILIADDELFIKHDESCIKHDELFIKHDELCVMRWHHEWETLSRTFPDEWRQENETPNRLDASGSADLQRR